MPGRVHHQLKQRTWMQETESKLKEKRVLIRHTSQADLSVCTQHQSKQRTRIQEAKPKPEHEAAIQKSHSQAGPCPVAGSVQRAMYGARPSRGRKPRPRESARGRVWPGPKAQTQPRTNIPNNPTSHIAIPTPASAPNPKHASVQTQHTNITTPKYKPSASKQDPTSDEPPRRDDRTLRPTLSTRLEVAKPPPTLRTMRGCT